MTGDDVPNVVMLDIGGSRGPSGWVEWNQREHAAEAASAVRDAARDSGAEHLVAIIRPNHVASQRVALTIGLSLEREVEKNGDPALIFGGDLT